MTDSPTKPASVGRDTATDVSFESPLLRAVVAVFLRRGRAIRYRPRSFELSRGIEATADGTRERLNLDLHPLGPRSAKLRLSLWPDGVAWICVSRAHSKASGIRGALHLTCDGVTPVDLCALFERSISVADMADTSAEIEHALMHLWAACAPEIDRLG